MQIVRITRKFRNILSSHQIIRIIELGIMMVFGGILETLSVSLILPFMNIVIQPESTMDKWYIRCLCDIFQIRSSRVFLVFLAVVLAFTYILKNLYLLLEYSVQYRFVYTNMFLMQDRLLNNLLNRPYEYFLHVNSGEIIRILTNDTPSTFILLTTILNIYTEMVVSGMLVITVFVIAPKITIIMGAVLMILLLIINLLIKPILSRAGRQYQESTAGMNKWIIQSIQGIKEIKVMSKESFFRESFRSYGRDNVNALRKNNVLNITPKFFIEAISMSAMFLMIGIMIYRGQNLESIVPVVSAVAMAAMRLLPSVNRISSSLASTNYYEPMLDKLIEDLEVLNDGTMKDTDYGVDLKCENGSVVKLKREITLKNISYRYPNTDKDILMNANLTVTCGESIGIIGSSGAGKTTAVDIILGLLCPQAGSVIVDGKNAINDLPLWRSQIGYIPQMIFMLDDTIRANVAFGENKEEVNDEEIWNALREAALEDTVREFRDGLDTQLGERGLRLSGGQRQRIGIARALYNKPSVLIFDEATSALDNETEAAIMESINSLRGKKTMIIIAHRLSTIEKCDHIYKVADGKIIKER